MTIYIVIHDGGFDDGIEVLGAYLDRVEAEASLVTRTPSGRRSTAILAHGWGCCEIIEREVGPGVHIVEGHEEGCREYVVGRCVLSRGRPPEELANIISAEYRRSRGD